MIDSPFPWTVSLNKPCGCLECHPRWVRTRENSLRLKDWELWLVWRGRGWMRTREHTFQLLPGFCALMRPGGIYDAGHDEENPLGITYIHFDPIEESSTPPGSVSAIQSWPEFFQVHDLNYLEAVMRRIVQLWRDEPKPATLLLNAVLSDLLQRPSLRIGIKSSKTLHQGRITEMIAAIHAQPGALPSVNEMAKTMKMSPEHFSRVFHKVTGQSPLDFLLHTRLMRARHLLAETDLSIAAIAEQLGYADLFFFSRQFKQKTGMPPSRYRISGLRDD